MAACSTARRSSWRRRDVLHFEMEQLMQHKALIAPVLTYLFHRLEARFDGRPTLLILDEAWTFLDDALFAARIREWLKTLRKKNVAVVFATQSLADIERSTIAPALIESCPTRIFLPNDRALEPQARAVYERFGLNARQIEILSIAAPKRDYYAQTARGNRLFELGLGPVALALCGASSPDDQRLIDRCVADGGPSGLRSAVPDAKGLAWAAELIERWPRPATPPPIPQVSIPIDPAEGAASRHPPPRQPGRTPSPKAAAPADQPRTDRRAAAWSSRRTAHAGAPVALPRLRQPNRRGAADETASPNRRCRADRRRRARELRAAVGRRSSPCSIRPTTRRTCSPPPARWSRSTTRCGSCRPRRRCSCAWTRTCCGWGRRISPDLQRTLGDIQTQLRAGDGIALRLQATQSGYEHLFPRQVSDRALDR